LEDALTSCEDARCPPLAEEATLKNLAECQKSKQGGVKKHAHSPYLTTSFGLFIIVSLKAVYNFFLRIHFGLRWLSVKPLIDKVLQMTKKSRQKIMCARFHTLLMSL